MREEIESQVSKPRESDRRVAGRERLHRVADFPRQTRGADGDVVHHVVEADASQRQIILAIRELRLADVEEVRS